MTHKHEDDIHNTTNTRLAELLEEHNKWRRGEPPYDKAGAEPPLTPTCIGEMLDEAAYRIRNIWDYKPTHFNSEDFDV